MFVVEIKWNDISKVFNIIFGIEEIFNKMVIIGDIIIFINYVLVCLILGKIWKLLNNVFFKKERCDYWEL